MTLLPASISLSALYQTLRLHWRRALLAVVLLTGAGWYWLDPFGQPTITYVTIAAERGDIEDSTTAVGTLQPFEYVEVGTQVSGQLRKIYVELGQSVKEGDLLAEIDSTVLRTKVDGDRAQLLSLVAQLADKQAKLRLSQQQFDRQTALKKANATSEDLYQSAQADLASAVAQIDVINAQIKTTESALMADEANLSYTKISAPMAGTVVLQLAKQGQTLNANQQAPIILRISDLSTMTVQTSVSEADINRLRVGMDVYFTTLGQNQKRWESKLRQILPEPDILNNVVLYKALFDIPNPNGELRSQMTAQVFFVSGKADNVIKVPVAALKPLDGKRQRGTRPATPAASADTPRSAQAPRPQSPRAGAGDGTQANRYRVQVQKPDGSVEDRTVTVGVMNRVVAEVSSGVAEGEKIVIGTHVSQKRGARTPLRLP